jgi:ankyrin repeat protein
VYRFRWVECQLRSLQSCPRSEDHLDRLLGSLPQSLDETYERMLCNIDHGLIEDARRILALLCFAPRPLTVWELIDGIAVEIYHSPGLNRKRRLQDSNDIREICLGFIDIGLGADPTDETYYEKELTSTVRIAHFSVQEYLESDRIRHQKAMKFSLTSVIEHAEIAQICLIYLLDPAFSSSELNETVLKEYPLARFAATYWYHHYKEAVCPDSKLVNLALKLFQRQETFLTWVRLHDIDRRWRPRVQFNLILDHIAAPVYYASLLGLDQVLYELINTGQLESMAPISTSKASKLINAQGGHYGNALQAASAEGHKEVVEQLLEKGAEINAQGGIFGNALQAASAGGYKEVMQQLLDKGAEINAQGGIFGNALQAASAGGYKEVMQQLLDKGAEINAQGGDLGNALQAASARGHKEVVQQLLEKGAKINAQGGIFGNALQAASSGGYKEVVQQLLNKGAEINAQDGIFGNALQAASSGGHKEVVQQLLEKGAEINAQGGDYGNALQAASAGGHKEVVQQLLSKGAKTNAQGEDYGR